MQTIVYSRISQDRTGEAAGVTRQEADGRALAAARGWTIAEVAIDNDISAAGRKVRPGFERVLTAIETGRVQVVIAWALDRLTRNRRDTLRLIEACQRKGATIALVRGSDLDMSTPAGRLTADLLAAVARSEIETKSDRQTRAAQQAAEQGKWAGGRRAFGYNQDGTTIREPEAQAVRDGYQWLLDGVPLRQVAVRWNSAGLLTPQGTRAGEPGLWTGATVSRALRKPRYGGLRAHRGEVVGEAQWSALVDLDTWHAAQAVMNAPGRRSVHGAQRLLTGVAVCGICGGGVHAGGGAPGRGVYRCASTQGHVSRKRQPVDDYVTGLVIERLSRPDAGRAFVRREEGPGNVELLREAERLRQRLDGLAEAYADGTLTQSQLRKGSERVRAALAEVEGRLATTTDGAAAAGRAVATAPDVRAAWAALDLDTQREIIKGLMVVRLLSPGRGVSAFRPESVEVTWTDSGERLTRSTRG